MMPPNSLYITVHFPPRFFASKNSVIDNMITNIPQSNVKITGLVTEISYHDTQLITISAGNLGNKKNIKKPCNVSKKHLPTQILIHFLKKYQRKIGKMCTNLQWR